MKIQEIIPLTVQGEGYWAGLPCSFVRLYGCPVGCYFCDTGYANGSTPEEGFTEMTPMDIAAQLKSRNVVISGGEPVINPGLGELITSLGGWDFDLAIETSGINWIDELEEVWVTFSPKDHVSPKESVDIFWEKASEIKIVIAEEYDYRFYEERIRVAVEKGKKVFLQPEWSRKGAVLPLLIAAANELPNIRISTQTHKYLGVK